MIIPAQYVPVLFSNRERHETSSQLLLHLIVYRLYLALTLHTTMSFLFSYSFLFRRRRKNAKLFQLCDSILAVGGLFHFSSAAQHPAAALAWRNIQTTSPISGSNHHPHHHHHHHHHQQQQHQTPNQQQHRLLKNQGRHRRIEVLLGSSLLTGNERRELESLQSLGDPYDSSLFPDAHMSFKEQHNQAFCDLLKFIQQEQQQQSSTSSTSSSSSVGGGGGIGGPIIYLDGADGATTRALLDAGIHADRLHVANEWPDTVQALQNNDYGVRNDNDNNDNNNMIHVHLGKLQDMDCTKLSFVGAYLDGCGGATQPIMDMVMAIFQGEEKIIAAKTQTKMMVLGFTLTNAEPTGRPVLDRIQDVTRFIRTTTSAAGLFQQMYHVGDDPERFGVDPDLRRQHETTTTTWLMLIQE